MTTPTLTGLRLTHYTLIMQGVPYTPIVIQNLGEPAAFVQNICLTLRNRIPQAALDLLIARIDWVISENPDTDFLERLNDSTTLIIKHYRLGIEG